ncbi:unnamed protein product, partial [Brenthis ino]
MRACLLLCAALALAGRPRAASHRPDPRLDHIKTQILAKLGLSSRPTPLGAPPRDVVRQILARAADPRPERLPEVEQSMREIIAIAHRAILIFLEFVISMISDGFFSFSVYILDGIINESIVKELGFDEENFATPMKIVGNFLATCCLKHEKRRHV